MQGITITKTSPSLGEGTFTIRNSARSLSAQISTTTGYGTAVTITKDEDGLVLYTGGGEGWVRLNVKYSQLTTGTVTGTFTLQIPKGTLIPDVEADDAADPDGRLRYYCIAAKNNSETEIASAIGAWTAPPGSGQASVQSISGETITLAEEPTSWPLKGFWVRHVGSNTYRYVLNRSGRMLYLKALSRAIYSMTGANDQLIIGDKLRYGSVTGVLLGKLLDFKIVSGSLEEGNAAVMALTTTYATFSTGQLGQPIYNERTKSIVANVTTYYGTVYFRCDRGFSAPPTYRANEILECVSDIDICVAETEKNYDGESVLIKPNLDMAFAPRPSIDERAFYGSLAPGESCKFWMQQHILANVPAHSAVTGNISASWY